MATKMWAIGVMVLCTIFTSVAQLMYKFGVNERSVAIKLILIASGLFLYGIGAILLIIALKGGELSLLYPIIATSYVWVSLGASYFFNESISMLKWVGITLIIAGVFYIGKGGSR